MNEDIARTMIGSTSRRCVALADVLHIASIDAQLHGPVESEAIAQLLEDIRAGLKDDEVESGVFRQQARDACRRWVQHANVHGLYSDVLQVGREDSRVWLVHNVQRILSRHMDMGDSRAVAHMLGDVGMCNLLLGTHETSDENWLVHTTLPYLYTDPDKWNSAITVKFCLAAAAAVDYRSRAMSDRNRTGRLARCMVGLQSVPTVAKWDLLAGMQLDGRCVDAWLVKLRNKM